MRLPLGLNNIVLQGFLLFMQLVQVFNSPILELLGNGDPRKTPIDLNFHFHSGHAFLLAYWSSAFGAMIVGVMEKQRVHHFFNRRLAAWAGVTVPVGEFEFAIAAHDL